MIYLPITMIIRYSMSMFNIIEKREIHFLHEIQSVAFKNLIQLSIQILTAKRHVHLIFILQYNRCKKYCVPNLNKLVILTEKTFTPCI